MSVSKTVTPKPGHIPDGTAVGCYLKREADVERREGRHAIPAPTATGVMSGGSVTLSGLAASTAYVLIGFVDEIQSVKVDATAGQFKLTFQGQQTGNIKFNATALEVEEALVALSNIAEGDVKVTGGPGNSGGTTPYSVKFLKAWAGTNVTQMTAANGGTPLSGGGAAATVTTTTQGSESGEEGKQRTCLFTTDAE
jgi:hypothetical protein